MKLALIRFLHLFMVVVVLLSSMGFGLVEHSCLLRGKRVYSIHDARPGCQRCQVQLDPSERSNQTTTIDRTDCCKDETRYGKVDTTSSLSHQLAKFIKTVGAEFGAGTEAVWVTLLSWSFVEQTNVPAADYGSPPPLAGRHLLAFVQAFLI